MNAKYSSFTWFVFLLLACTNSDKQPTEQPERPNILWIIAEDLSPDLTCYGYEGIHTPNLDQLAARGVRFEKAFTTAPVCAPSRTALAVGTYQTAINAHHMRYPNELKNELPEGVIPINEVFRRHGYQTALFKEAPANNKTDWSFATNYTEYDANNWKALVKDKPFFAYFNLKLTHRPFEQDTIHSINPTTIKVPPYYPNHPVVQEDFAQYLESVQIMDRQVGEVLNALEQHGFSDNTVVIFLSDHGRPMSRGKNNLYDSGMQIPLVMAAPPNSVWADALQKGSSNNQLVSAIDITATSLAFAGIDKPDWMQGRVLFGKNKEAERKATFCALDRIGESHFKSRAVRTQKWKYIKNYNRKNSINEMATAYRKAMHPIYHLLKIYDEKGLLNPAQQALVRPMPPEELYNLEEDPFEIDNLAEQADFATTLEEMRGQLSGWQHTIKDYGMEEDSEALKAAFEKYGSRSRGNYQAKIAKMEARVMNIINN